MNTSKQVNAMIGLFLLLAVILGGYWINEGNRQDTAREEVSERNARRGARLFALNCRACHGQVGEGAFAPRLDGGAFLVLGGEFEEAYVFDDDAGALVSRQVGGLEPTSVGVSDSISRFLTTTIACGRTGSPMPSWSEQFGGTLSDTQIEHIVTMIVNGRWDLVVEQAHELDEEAELSEEEIAAIVITDAEDFAAFPVTLSNCGQYRGDAVREFRGRDPFSATPVATAPPSGTEPAATAAPGAGVVQVSMAEYTIEPAVASAAADGVTFRVANDGRLEHEFVVIRSELAVDALPQAGGAVDESQVEVVGRIEQWSGGDTEEATFSLSAGRYVLICNIPGHYQLGMRAAFTVE